ncbi:hypothetical protein [Streptomyces sp. NPDC048392]|uniref:hypothetical protein n=1 Tax=Streptomyces sp. NPDC048392 TaxID=3365543 RepID=UPI00371FC6C2
MGRALPGRRRVSVRLAVKTVPLRRWRVTREPRRRVKDALDEAGVGMPFPRRTV